MRFHPREALFKLCDMLERCVPTSLELAGNQSLLRVYRLIAPRGQRRLVARRLDLAPQHSSDIIVRLCASLGCPDRSVHRVLGNGLDELTGNGTVDPHTADANAQARGHWIAGALVTMCMTGL